MSMSDRKSIKLPKQHCAYAAPTLFRSQGPRVFWPAPKCLGADQKTRGLWHTLVLTKRHGYSGDEIVFLVVTWSAYTTFNKSSTGDKKDFLLKNIVHFFFL